MPARHPHDSATGSFTGRFTMHASDASLVLAGSDVRLIFNAVQRHDLPSSLDGMRVERRDTERGGSGAPVAFQLTSAGRRFFVHARSLQIHERAALYGKVIILPKFPVRQRALWAVLLTVARFDWGQALIRRVTGRKA